MNAQNHNPSEMLLPIEQVDGVAVGPLGQIEPLPPAAPIENESAGIEVEFESNLLRTDVFHGHWVLDFVKMIFIEELILMAGLRWLTCGWTSAASMA